MKNEAATAFKIITTLSIVYIASNFYRSSIAVIAPNMRARYYWRYIFHCLCLVPGSGRHFPGPVWSAQNHLRPYVVRDDRLLRLCRCN